MSRRLPASWALAELLRGAVAVALALGVMAAATTATHVGRWMGPRWWADGAAIVLTGALGLALSMPVRAIAAIRRRDGAVPVLPLVGLGVAAAGVVGLCAWWRVGAARSAIVAQIEAPTWRVGEHFTDEIWTLLIAGAGLWLMALLWGVAGVVWARRRVRGSVVVATIAAGVAVAAVVAEGIVRSAVGFIGYREGCGGGPGMIRYRYESFAEAGAPIVSMRGLVLLAAGIASVAILGLAWLDRRRPSLPRGAPRAAGALFAAGLAAFASTRGVAHDAGHPPPLLELDAGLYLQVPAGRAAALPPAGACDRDVVDGPLMSLEADGRWQVDGMRMSDIAEVAAILSAKRGLWMQIQPDRPFPGLLQAAIPAATPLAEVAPVVEIARGAGFTSIAALEVLPAQTWPTRTLGDLAYLPRGCWVKIDIDRRLPREGTWGQLVRAAAP